MAFINQGRHLSVVGLTAAALMELQIKTQGNIPDPTATPPLIQFPYSGTPGSSQEIERTLTSLPDFQLGETVTGSINSYTATYEGVTLVGTTELATSVGGGYGGPGEEHGYGGGSGGGGASNNWGNSGGGLAVAGQGNPGGLGGDRNAFSGAGGGGGGAGGGGGGAGAAGTAGGGNTGGNGGAGLANFYRDGNTGGSTVGTHIFAGGGGSAGGNQTPNLSPGGSGGGGTGTSGVVNTGSGGGHGQSAPGNGGSGIVVVRYDTSQAGFSIAGGTTNTYTTGAVNYKSHTFLSSGNIVVTGTGNIDTMIISGGGGSGRHGPANVEGGWFGGGGGAGGMHVATSTQIVPGTYAVAVGAGGTGSSQPSTGAGNLSWITPRRTISLSEPTGAFVTGETLTGATSGATGDIIIYTP